MTSDPKLGPYLLGPNGEYEGIYTGDARDLVSVIPNESIDLLFTDPVYWQIDDYRWLAETAARILKVGGNLIAQTCSEYRYLVESAMRESNHLESCPLLMEVLAGAPRKMWKYNLGQMCKPYVWFCKGSPTKRIGGYTGDATYGKRKDKRFHKWGDSAYFFSVKIQDFTGVGDIVFDPFTGGGTIPAVCKMLDRHWLAFEIDPEISGGARERLRNTQSPLFMPQPEQIHLPID